MSDTPRSDDGKPRATGNAIRRTGAERKALARVKPEEIQAARLDWKRNTRAGYGPLIDAERED